MSKSKRDPAKKTPDTKSAGGADIDLSAPWGMPQGARNVAIGGRGDTDFGNNFVKERTRLHEIYIREEARTKRIGLILAFLLILAAASIMLFAPAGREFLSYWIGSALIIFAAGAVGFSRVWGRAAKISFGADQDKRGLNE